MKATSKAPLINWGRLSICEIKSWRLLTECAVKLCKVDKMWFVKDMKLNCISGYKLGGWPIVNAAHGVIRYTPLDCKTIDIELRKCSITIFHGQQKFQRAMSYSFNPLLRIRYQRKFSLDFVAYYWEISELLIAASLEPLRADSRCNQAALFLHDFNLSNTTGTWT